jgi:hypothetical protein
MPVFSDAASYVNIVGGYGPEKGIDGDPTTHFVAKATGAVTWSVGIV